MVLTASDILQFIGRLARFLKKRRKSVQTALKLSADSADESTDQWEKKRGPVWNTGPP